MSGLTSSSTSSLASSISSYQSFLFIIFSQFCDKNSLFKPGAIFIAIMAASIANVPLPQKGSMSILSFFHGVSMISAAARVSVIGAFATFVL